MSELASGKGHRDENFPVASWLLKPEHRVAVLAFYRFARAADDIADHSGAVAAEKLARLDAMRASLAGERDDEPLGVALRAVPHGAEHGLDLLEAFRRDVVKRRYVSWDELIDYCRHSAMPVGRFVCDTHEEDRGVWALSDPLCAALQVINHLQDCGKDFRAIDRVYLPADLLAAEDAGVDELGAARASPGLLRTIRVLARRTLALLDEAAPFAGAIRNRRLALEVAVIHRLAVSLATRLTVADPLSERVHHGKLTAGGLALGAALRQLVRR